MVLVERSDSRPSAVADARLPAPGYAVAARRPMDREILLTLEALAQTLPKGFHDASLEWKGAPRSAHGQP